MAKPPSSKAMPNVGELAEGEVHELAEAYLDLLKLMVEALEECAIGYGFFSWNGRGFEITGHPPHDLVERLSNE